ncbi:carbon storage regulator CsrA [Saliterribacillus persicus]|uniref:Translational regulator CsrA n=1 Tax=Saliterribacillus persicus TaxID=930114 RepID=A0A368Y961_9BACI|nr:carbon storage regulator CsrA [Saliterribacillus persicus]RCW74724.1 carbon storage regulator CsrA [Saliterribacillus persicus]
MLVLTRKINEAIKISDDIEVRIVAIDGDQVKLGITAPSDVDIYRQEIYEAIKAENSEAASISEDFIKLLKKNDKKY